MPVYNHRVDSERPPVRWNQHARWAADRYQTAEDYERGNRPSWPVAAFATLVLFGMVVLAVMPS